MLFLVLTGWVEKFAINFGLLVISVITALIFYYFLRAHSSQNLVRRLVIIATFSILISETILFLNSPMHSLFPTKLFSIAEDVRKSSTCNMADDLEAATIFFEDNIDISKIRIYFITSDLYLKLSSYFQPAGASAWGNIIYIKDADMCDEDIIFVHELTHIWQYQSGKGIGFKAIPQWINYYKLYYTDKNALYDYGGIPELEKSVENGKKFNDFTIEQQAVIIQHLYEIQTYHLSSKKDYVIEAYHLIYNLTSQDFVFTPQI